MREKNKNKTSPTFVYIKVQNINIPLHVQSTGESNSVLSDYRFKSKTKTVVP